jgi:uncharacterized tellurite resistance protein B-like protein
MMMVLGSSIVFRVVPIEDFFTSALNMANDNRLDHLDKLFTMVCSDSSLEILLYNEILHVLQEK